jgi:hypothetical protein
MAARHTGDSAEGSEVAGCTNPSTTSQRGTLTATAMELAASTVESTNSILMVRTSLDVAPT